MSLRGGWIARAAAVLALAAYAAPGAAEPAATGLRFGEHPGKTRIVLDLSERVAFETASETAPERIILRLPPLAWSLDGRPIPVKGLVKAVRHGTESGQGARVVLELRRPAKVASAYYMAPGPGTPHFRLVIDLAETDATSFAAAARPAETAAPPSRVAALPPPAAPSAPEAPAPQAAPAAPAPQATPAAPVPQATPAAPAPQATPAAPAPQATPAGPAPRAAPGSTVRQAAAATPPATAATPPVARRSDRKKVVVIDPGHGGADSGAVSARGLVEKDLALGYAQELRRRLVETGRYHVVLTRERDVFLRLRERIAIARAAEADLFISLHADSIADRSLRGGSVYTLSENASDEEAAALATKENKADLIAGVDLSGQRREVVNILIDLAQRKTKDDSTLLARRLVDELSDGHLMLRKSLRSAGFAVLKAPDVPAVLFEMGYLSNAEDEAVLSSAAGRDGILGAVVRAIDRFFDAGPTIARP